MLLYFWYISTAYDEVAAAFLGVGGVVPDHEVDLRHIWPTFRLRLRTKSNQNRETPVRTLTSLSLGERPVIQLARLGLHSAPKVWKFVYVCASAGRSQASERRNSQ